MKELIKILCVVIFVIVVGVVASPRVPGLSQSVQSWLDQFQINLGLDLQGGLHLEYALDLSDVDEEVQLDAVNAVQAVIERRVNALGVGEPIVQIAQRGLDRYLIVELPGVEDVQRAKDVIKETPFLEFREERTDAEVDAIIAPLIDDNNRINAQAKEQAESLLARVIAGEDFAALATEFSADTGSAVNGGKLPFVTKGQFVKAFEDVLFSDLADGAIHPEVIESAFGYHVIQKIATQIVEESETDEQEISSRHILIAKEQLTPATDVQYKPTDLTGRYLEGAVVNFGGSHSGGISSPEVALQFDEEGAQLFKELTESNLGKSIAIFVDGEIISAPTVQVIITNGQAVINGGFTLDEAKALAGRLNEGALPVPIELVSQQSVEASIGIEALQKSVTAGAVGLALVVLYMIFYYRILGFFAGASILIYAASVITVFKLSGALGSNFAVTLSLAGFAGLILSIGMAVDANILIFERLKEELRRGRPLDLAIDESFDRAWSAIRDGNLSTIITALILMTIGTGFVAGFAIVLIIGVLISMFTAIILMKIIMKTLLGDWLEKRPWMIYNTRK